MKRLYAALVILIGLTMITAAGSHTVKKVTGNMEYRLTEIEKLADHADYESAQKETEELIAYWQKEEHRMAVFLRRDYTNAIGVALSTIPNFLYQGSECDLHGEINRARAQIALAKHLYFSFL